MSACRYGEFHVHDDEVYLEIYDEENDRPCAPGEVDAVLRGPLRERMREGVLGATLADTGIFDRRTLEHLVAAHLNASRDYSAPLWTVLMFESFWTILAL